MPQGSGVESQKVCAPGCTVACAMECRNWLLEVSTMRNEYSVTGKEHRVPLETLMPLSPSRAKAISSRP